MNKAIVPIYEVCSGCRVCELACSLSHFGYINPKKSRITIVKKGLKYDLAVVCNQGISCNVDCVASCPVEAIKKEDGIVKIIEDECIGCEACVEACPYNAIKMIDMIAIKCDLCNGEPQCVKFCPLHAIIYEEGRKQNYDDVKRLASQPKEEVQ